MQDYRAARCNKCGLTPSAHGIDRRRNTNVRVFHPFVFVYPNEK